jgi:CBS domain containing-hemolysin-like protein
VTTGQLLLWLGLMLLGFAGSAIYSGMETGCYCLNRVRLHVRATRRERAAIRLENLIGRQTSLLSTLLIGNNIANYLGTASLAVILSASGLSDAEQIIINVALVTPILFVFGETLPKDLFSAHADGLMYRLQWILTGSRRLFTWTLLVPIVSVFSAGVMRVLGQRGGAATFHPRRRVGDLVKESVGSGLLTDRQSEMVERVLGAATLDAASQMTPWRRVSRVRPNDRLAAVIERSRVGEQPAIPVVDAAGQVAGVVRVLDALRLEPGAGQTIADLLRPAKLIANDLPLRRALTELTHDNVEMAVVTNRAGQPIGIVTPQDLLEPITGPLPV